MPLLDASSLEIELRGVHKRYDERAERAIFSALDLAIPRGSFTVLVGPSGCGKSTLLRMIAGLEAISAGDLLFDGVRVNDKPPVARGVAMVFQNYALYGHMSVYDNIGFGLAIARVPKAVRHAAIVDAARQLDLEALLQRKPAQLSGGQRQRVAIGRAIVRRPRAFLFDEPLSNLDASLRGTLRAEIAELHKRLRTTTVYVTHDQIEAMTLADQIVVLSPQGLEQVGTPDALYDTPANVFVAGFIGSQRMNLLPVDATHAAALQALGAGSAAALVAAQVAQVGIRPEDVVLVAGDAAQVLRIERLGAESLVWLRLGDASFTALSTDRTLAPGCAVGVAARRHHRFDGAGRCVIA
ncbi:ABC transporter ATP-binding protein [Aquabacterium sp.]|uniref:ABC transporter ATP-binding protein n=1 Tax=Aquabacterium sp. TaxID=1872578 RepID=UPI002B6FF9C4|nr:ATP-binding cassette domain-containing protein [Aquabacterium sp.]HSW08318.1 ATP-binding cassette domain-containing protein [Aquabacterium sp.]